MSGSLKPDRQFDFGGGINEFASRFKTKPNGLYVMEDCYVNGGGALTNYPDAATVNAGTLGNALTAPTIIESTNGSPRFVYADAGVVKLGQILNGTKFSSVGSLGFSLGSNSGLFVSGWNTSYTNVVYNTWDGTTGRFFVTTAQQGAAPSRVLAVPHKGYAFLVASSSNGANNRFSVQNTFGTWPANSDFDVGEQNDWVMAGKSFKGVLFEFKPENTWVITGDGPGTYTSGGIADFRAYQISSAVGCSYHHTIVEIEGKLWMLTNRGIEIFDGANFNIVTEDIDLRNHTLNLRHMLAFDPYVAISRVRAAATFDAERNMYILSLPFTERKFGAMNASAANLRARTYGIDVKRGTVSRLKTWDNDAVGLAGRRVCSFACAAYEENTTDQAYTSVVGIQVRQSAAGGDQFYILSTEPYNGGAVADEAISAFTISTGFKHWGAPELPKWPTQIQLFANPEASFSSGVIANEDQSVSLGAISVPASGIATIPIPQSLNGGGNFYGLRLTTNAVECKIDGIVFWGHVGDAPREET